MPQSTQTPQTPKVTKPALTPEQRKARAKLRRREMDAAMASLGLAAKVT